MATRGIPATLISKLYSKPLLQMMKRIDLPPCFNITMVEHLKQVFQSALASDGEIELNISDIEKADSCGLQLLYAFLKAAKTSERKVSLTGESTVFTATSELLGFGSLLSDGLEK